VVKSDLYSGQGLDTAPTADATAADVAAAATSNSAAQHLDRNKLMSLLAQLRKATNHPFLFPGIEKVCAAALSAFSFHSRMYGELLFGRCQ
jgi:hypothetical protein